MAFWLPRRTVLTFQNTGREAKGTAWIQRWEHWIAADPKPIFDEHWERVAIPGKKWRSGSQAYTYVARAA